MHYEFRRGPAKQRNRNQGRFGRTEERGVVVIPRRRRHHCHCRTRDRLLRIPGVKSVDEISSICGQRDRSVDLLPHGDARHLHRSPRLVHPRATSDKNRPDPDFAQ